MPIGIWTMSDEFPVRWSPRHAGIRCMLILAGGLLLGLLLIARFLEPDPSGMGTHRQLGLPECGFFRYFGVPCPSCGMTTSWAYLTRGQLIASARANVGGTMLGVMSGVTGIWLIVSGWTGRWWGGCPRLDRVAWVAGLIVATMLLNWMVRVFL